MNMKSYALLALLTISRIAMADMQVMTEEELQLIDGQAGADISLEMRLNQKPDYSFDDSVCTSAKIEYCRFALNFNNRYEDRTLDTYDMLGIRTPSPTGKKMWLVFKQVQGTIKFQEIKLDAVDLAPYTGDVTNAVVQKTAIQLGFDATKPVLIRNFGFQSLAIETDTCTETNLNCSTGTTNAPGYLAKGSGGSGAGAYVDGKYIAPGFDQGKEVGFMGLNIHGNLALKATMRFFSCDANHPRC